MYGKEYTGTGVCSSQKFLYSRVKYTNIVVPPRNNQSKSKKYKVKVKVRSLYFLLLLCYLQFTFTFYFLLYDEAVLLLLSGPVHFEPSCNEVCCLSQ